MGRIVSLGQEAGASLNITADGKTLTWYVPAEQPQPWRLWVSMDGKPRILQAQGGGGVESPPWVTAGHLWRWDLTGGATDTLLASMQADIRNGFPLTQTVIPVAAPIPAAVPAAALPPSAGAPAATVPAPGGPSWFDQQSFIAGVPNLYLALVGGLAAVLLLRKKR